MNSRSSIGRDALRRRRQRTLEVKLSLRAVAQQLALLNHQAADRIGLRDADLLCFDLIERYGPLTPRDLAARSGLHPATLTGILDRLETGRWIARARDAADRRAVRLQPLGERSAELTGKYRPMNARMDEICAGFDDAELETIARFLQRTEDAGRLSTLELQESPETAPKPPGTR